MRIDGPQVTSSLSLNGTTITDLNVFVTTGSLNGLTGSYATTGSNLFKGTQTLSGSIIPAVNNTYDLGSPTHQFRHVYISTGSLYIDGTKVLGSTSSELQITTDVGQSFKVLETGADTITLQSADGNVTLTATGGGDIVMDPSTGVIGLKGTVTIYTGNKITSSDGNAIQFGNGIAITGSIIATGTALVSGSSQVLNGSGVWSGSAQLPSGIISSSLQLPSGLISGSSQITSQGYATTGSNNFIGTQTITGSLFISQNLVVQGSSSLENITASAVNIGSNIVNLNTATPAIRFAGINVFDSGSIGGSGSFLYDSVQDEFIFIHRGDNTNITSSVVMMGPQTYNNVGSEIYPTNNRILKGTGNEHIGDSIISETGGGIGISGSLSITGSIVSSENMLLGVDKGIIFDSSGASGNPEISIDSNVDLNFKNSAGLTNLKLKNNGDTIISGSLSLTGNITSTATPLVSGSSQINVLSTTNISRIATTGSNSFTGTQTFGYGRLVASGHNSSAQITINASYDGGQTNTYTPDYAGDSTAGMLVMKQSNGGYGDLNFYGKNHQTTGGSHNISTFNVIMGMNANGRVGIGKLIANAPLDVNGNTLVTGSITSTGTVSAGTTINWNGGIGALSYGSGVVTLETNTANEIQLKTNGTTAITISTGQTTTFANNVGLGVTPLTKLHLQGSSPNYILLTNTAADGVPNAIQGGIIGQSRGYSNNLSQMASILFRNENSAAWFKGEITFNTNESDGTNPAVSPIERLRIASGGNIGINVSAPTRKLAVNFGTSVNDGLIVYGSQRQNTVFQSTGEHCFIYIDSFHNNTFLPVLHLQRSSNTFGTVGLQRASNSDGIGAYAESEMVVGTSTTVPFSVQTNSQRRIRVASGGGVEVFNSLSVSGNLSARNFSRSIKTWYPAGGTGSYTIVTYNWADELAALSGNFDSGGYYKGFLRSANGAHYNGYHFDILVGSIGYGSNSLQFKVQNITPAHSPWAGGCGPTPFGTIDNTSFEHRNNPCGEALELSITKLGL